MTVTAMLSVSPVDDASVDFEAEIARAVDALEGYRHRVRDPSDGDNHRRRGVG
jgi:uncharacterized protein YqgV (UPF0045/DUF77 family)